MPWQMDGDGLLVWDCLWGFFTGKQCRITNSRSRAVLLRHSGSRRWSVTKAGGRGQSPTAPSAPGVTLRTASSPPRKIRDSLSPFSLLHGANRPEPSPALLPSLDVLQPLQVFLEVRDEFRRKHFHKASPDSTKQQLTNLLPVSSQYSIGRNIEGN